MLRAEQRKVLWVVTDGFRVALYTLPISETHRGFFPPGYYAECLAHIGRVAASEGVVWMDFDTGHEFGFEDYVDTHHLHVTAARRFSARFAVELLLPALGD